MMPNNRPGVRIFLDVDSDNKPTLRDEELMSYEIKGLGIAFRDRDQCVEEVDLFVTTKRIIIIGETLTLDFDVAYITLHAVTRDPASYVKPCVYCQLDFEEDDDEDDDDEENSPMLKHPKGEMFLIPKNDLDLTEIYNAFSHAALLNPDPPEDGEEEGDDELIYNIDEVELGVEQSQALEHLESVFHLPNDHVEDSDNFEDAP